MSIRRQILLGGAVLVTGKTVGKVCGFARNIIIARIISPEDFGIAATFGITFSLFEMISDTGADRLLVQARDGDSPRLQRTAQFLLLIRGLILGAVMYALAWPISALFDIPQALWAFRWLALIPIVRGLGHLDMKRMHRDMRFAPFALTDAVSQVVVAAAAWPLAAWLNDYSVVLWLLIAQSLALTVGSHLIAKRRYGWAIDWMHLRSLLRFGWPLMVNGMVLFATIYASQAIVGVFYSMEDLGIYSVAVRLASLATVLVGVGGMLLLPILSRVQDSRERFLGFFGFSMQLHMLVGAVVSAPLILAGDLFVITLFGEKYAAAGNYVGWLAAGQALLLMRGSAISAAIALGDTKNLMISNTFRASGLVGALSVALLDGRLSWVAASALGGEIVGLVASLVLLRLKHAIPMTLCFTPAVVLGTTCIAAASLNLAGAQDFGWSLVAPVCMLLGAILVGSMVLISPGFRRRARNLVFG